jgi:hypothetical protein
LSKIFASGGADEAVFVKFAPYFATADPRRRRIKRGGRYCSRIQVYQKNIYVYVVIPSIPSIPVKLHEPVAGPFLDPSGYPLLECRFNFYLTGVADNDGQ